MTTKITSILKPLLLTVGYVVILATAPGATFAQQPATAPASPVADWREQYAYTLGVQAFTFGFPWVFLPEIRWQWVTQPRNPRWVPYAPLNQFWHARELANAAYRDGGGPNSDTMYSTAWLNLSREPLILSVPDVGDRYYTFEMASMDSDNFAYVGKRTTGTKAGHFAIIGPDWKGKLPTGVKQLPRSRTPTVLVLGRTLVYGPDDVANVHKLQDQYKLTPLSLWGKKDATLPASRDVWKPFDSESDPLAAWKTMNRAMTENPPHENHRSMVKNFAHIGVGPNQDVERMDDATKRGLTRAAQDGMKLLREVIVAGVGKKVNGWTYPPATMGRAGLHDDFLTRASIQCLAGIIANDPAEAVYLNTALDAEGKRLAGTNRYVIRFAPGGLPKVGAFWSVTMYGMDNNLVDNPLNRYKLGTYPKGELKLDPDGGITLYVQSESPGKDKEPNWLPAPKDEFYLILRTYMPATEIVNQEWAPPAVARVE